MNLSSGWEDKDSTLARIQEILSGARIELVRKGFECGEIARDAVRRAARAVVAAGGDGTVRAVGEALAGTGVPLGVIPAGTFNHFARDLGVPLDIEAAAAALIRSGRIAQADAGEVNGRVFVSNAILGLYPAARQERAQEERRGAEGPIAVAGAALITFRRNRRARACAPGRARDRQKVGPHRDREQRAQDPGYEIGSRARLDAGRLWIYNASRGTRGGGCSQRR